MRARFFGQHLLATGVLTAQQLLAALEYQERHNRRLGDCAVGLGLLTPFEVEQIRALQAREDLRFGEAAIKLGLLDEPRVQQVLAAQSEAHVALGEALTALGYLSAKEVEAAAAEFLATEAQTEPELFALPEDLPERELALELFHLAHKLLLRACDLPSKTEPLRLQAPVLPLSDRSALVAITGALDTSVMLSLPDVAAAKIARRFSGEVVPNDEDTDRIVCELARLLCGNLQSVMAERGIRLQPGAPALLGASIALPPGRIAAVVPFATHHGEVLVGLALPG